MIRAKRQDQDVEGGIGGVFEGKLNFLSTTGIFRLIMVGIAIGWLFGTLRQTKKIMSPEIADRLGWQQQVISAVKRLTNYRQENRQPC